MTIFDNRVIENFLSNDEIETILSNTTEHLTEERCVKGFDQFGEVTRESWNIFTYHQDYKSTHDILVPKLLNEFGKNLVLNSTHILNSYHEPYNIHNDVNSANYQHDKDNTNLVPAWTFIIPLHTVDSNTITFAQSDEYIKTIGEWIEKRSPPNHGMQIDDDTYDKYLSHTPRWVYDYITLEKIFPWTKGTIYASNRRKFHTSDNYPARGVKKKQAIVMWTSIQVE